jgi:hypothetical protein
MDTYHKLNNKWFSTITEIKTLFERLPERGDYTAFNFKIPLYS